MNTREASMRAYLQALTDPKALRDEETISKLQQRLQHSEDPLERVRLQGQLDQAKQVSPDAYEDGFIAYAKEWAEEHGVPAEAFRAEGVPRTVLRRAGLDGGPSTRRRKGPAARRGRVSRDDVRVVVRDQTSFTLPQIQSKTGASRETVRAVIRELLDTGELVNAGPDHSQGGKGRPTLYRWA